MTTVAAYLSSLYGEAAEPTSLPEAELDDFNTRKLGGCLAIAQQFGHVEAASAIAFEISRLSGHFSPIAYGFIHGSSSGIAQLQ